MWQIHFIFLSWLGEKIRITPWSHKGVKRCTALHRAMTQPAWDVVAAPSPAYPGSCFIGGDTDEDAFTLRCTREYPGPWHGVGSPRGLVSARLHRDSISRRLPPPTGAETRLSQGSLSHSSIMAFSSTSNLASETRSAHLGHERVHSAPSSISVLRIYLAMLGSSCLHAIYQSPEKLVTGNLPPSALGLRHLPR